jgi:eukaryotic-like serine/threonine-protein kinase
MQSHADFKDDLTQEAPPANRNRSSPSGIVPTVRPPGPSVVPAPRTLVRRAFGWMGGCVVGKRYRITRAIGSGGVGTIFEAIDLQTGCEVALKALSRVDGNVNALKRLRREAETAVAVRSDYVCQVHYLGVEDGTPFIVMERLHGEPLRARLGALGALPLADAFAITCQLLDALSATHATGVIHRDVKPSNIFMTSARGARPRLKLIDFGLAKLLQADVSSISRRGHITAPDNIPGTLHYLAPEQLLGAPIDQRVDVYAAGLALYEMLSGVRAYSGETLDGLVRRIIFEALPRVFDLRDDLPPEIDDVLAMALAKDPNRRFLTAGAFRRALVAVCERSVEALDGPVSFRSEALTLLDLDQRDLITDNR